MQLVKRIKGGDKMSEGAIPIRKAIPIIVVTWILSLVTTLAIVYYALNASPKTWHKVVTFAEEYDVYTREEDKFFHVPSEHWKIEWTVMPNTYPPSEDAWFAFHLDSEDYITFTQVAVTPTDFEWYPMGHSGTEYITDSGDFSITVSGEGVLWAIKVEAYY